jgi:uncharacterized protein involved in exopolysaccharide biosynthesis
MAVVTKPRGLPLLSDYKMFMRRHRTVIGALMGIGLLVGLVVGVLQPSTYSATASIALTPVPVYVSGSTTELVPPAVTIDTDAQLLGSPRVLGALGHELDVDQGEATEQLSVTASPNSHVLQVTVSAASPRLAATAANAAADAFIEVRRDSLGALQDSQFRQLRYLVSLQERALAKEQATRLVMPDQDELFAQILELRTSLDELEEASAEPADVLSAAEDAETPDHANLEVPTASGAMLGLLLACLLGIARDRRRPSVPTRTPANKSGDQPNATLHERDYHHAV